MEHKKLMVELEKLGCDTEAALSRSLDDTDFYIKCLEMFLSDEGAISLGEYIEDRKIKEAFECSHMMKGVTANLGLTPIYKTLCDIVEPLRAGNMNGVADNYAKFTEQLTSLRELVDEQ